MEPINEISNPNPNIKRNKFLWRVFFVFNFALGAYIFANPGKKVRGKEKSEAPAEVANATPAAAAEVTVPTKEEPIFAPPILIPRPVITRQPIPADQQREIFKWMLEEKRKLKPQNRQEKRRINEEKAILKDFIRSNSILNT